MKVNEFNSAEETHKSMNERFAVKLEELEEVNTKMRKIILAKEKESEEFVKKLKELHNKFNTLEKDTENTSLLFKNTLLEKDLKIEELNKHINLLERLIDQRDRAIEQLQDNLKNVNNSNMKINEFEFLSTMENTKNDLEAVKEKFNFKYSKLKEKCYFLKKEKIEKENFIKV